MIVEHEMLEYDYNKLRGRIVEKFGSLGKFATAMQWTEKTLSNRMNNKLSWRQNDITQALMLLELDIEDVGIYFFNYKS